MVFAIKDKFLSTNIFFEEGECLFTTSSKDRRLVEEFYSNLKYTLKNKGNLLCYRKSYLEVALLLVLTETVVQDLRFLES